MAKPGEMYNKYQNRKVKYGQNENKRIKKRAGIKSGIKTAVKTVGKSAKLLGKIVKGVGKAIVGKDLDKNPKKMKLKGDYHQKAQNFIKKYKAKGASLKAKDGTLVAYPKK